MLESVKIAGVVTLYNSTPTTLKNIETYQSQVQTLFVIDNSDITSSYFANELKLVDNVVYFSNNGNYGIASSLNQAASMAASQGYDYLLTMDDDSRMPAEGIPVMVDFINNFKQSNLIGIISVAHAKPISDQKPQYVLTTMTSGNLLNLSVYKKVGPFRDDFFIDHVDHEYCLRLNKAGYKVVELPSLLLDHKLGERKSIGWRGQTYVSHSPLRGYYYIRNGLVLISEYRKHFPEFCSHLQILLIKESLKALFLEPKKWLRLHLLWRGVVDWWSGRLGKFSK